MQDHQVHEIEDHHLDPRMRILRVSGLGRRELLMFYADSEARSYKT